MTETANVGRPGVTAGPATEFSLFFKVKDDALRGSRGSDREDAHRTGSHSTTEQICHKGKRHL
jgi:hypothetical protein